MKNDSGTTVIANFFLTLTGYKSYLFSFVVGMIYPLGLAPVSFWPAMIVSLSAFFGVLKYSKASLTWNGFFFGLGQFGVGTSWVYVSIHEFGNAPVALALFITFLFTAYLSLYPALLGFLFNKYLKIVSRPKKVLLFLFLWLLIDGLRGWVFSGFPWLYAGYSTIDTTLVGWAPLIGIHGLTLMVLWQATLLLDISLKKQIKVPVLIILTLWLTGWGLEQVSWSTVDGAPRTATLVQPNIPQDLKWEADHLNKTLNILNQLTLQSKGEIIIWPESALPVFEDRIRPFLTLIAKRSALQKQTVITGVPIRDVKQNKYYAGTMLLDKDNIADSQKYYKRRLVPFGEYVPFEDTLRGVIEFFDLPMSGFSLGPAEQKTLKFDHLSMGVAICYEIVYPNLVYDQSRDANVLLTISNDAWFGDSWGPHQHLQMARMRAVEIALPILRGTNNGITAMIDYKGNITAQLPQFVRKNLEITFQPRRSHSPILFYNFWWLAIILLGTMLLVFVFKNRFRTTVVDRGDKNRTLAGKVPDNDSRKHEAQ